MTPSAWCELLRGQSHKAHTREYWSIQNIPCTSAPASPPAPPRFHPVPSQVDFALPGRRAVRAPPPAEGTMEDVGADYDDGWEPPESEA